MQFCDRCGEAIVSALGHFPHVNCQPQSDLPRICADLHAALAAERQRAEKAERLLEGQHRVADRLNAIAEDNADALFSALMRAEAAEAELKEHQDSYAQLGRDYDALETDRNVLQGQLGDVEAERDRLRKTLVDLVSVAQVNEQDCGCCVEMPKALFDCASAALAACEQGGKGRASAPDAKGDAS